VRLLYVADGRSPIALNWIRHFVDAGHEVHLVSTYPCSQALKLASLTVVPVAFSGMGDPPPGAPMGDAGPRLDARRRSYPGRMGRIRLRSFVRHWLGPLTISSAAQRAREIVKAIRPDLVHAMRIPLEGMLAARAVGGQPLVLSVWGNDFTLHARASPGMAIGTRRALRRADALHADCRRDLLLSHAWGLAQDKPGIVLPGNGGIRPEIFHSGAPAPPPGSPIAKALGDIPSEFAAVVNPRGFRAYVHNPTFFRAIPRILEGHPETVFLCPAMADEPLALKWLDRLGIRQSVRLMPKLTAQEMAAVFRRSQVMVSPSSHDGTPNTLLEAMACGAFPVAGDLESIREWIEDGVNGLLINPRQPGDLASAVERALMDEQLRHRAAEHNLAQVNQRALYEDGMRQAEALYRRFLA